MILVKREDHLPAVVRSVKQEVLLCFQVLHMLHVYDTVADLTAYLDAQLADAGLTKLRRVVLFYSDPQVRMAVEDRMAILSRLETFQQPGCWMQFQPQLPQLRRWADRYEPGFVARELAKG